MTRPELKGVASRLRASGAYMSSFTMKAINEINVKHGDLPEFSEDQIVVQKALEKLTRGANYER